MTVHIKGPNFTFFSIYINWTDNQNLHFMKLEALYNYKILFILMITLTAMMKNTCNVNF
jgi:hypothetical protein